MNPNYSLRAGQPADLLELQQLFVSTIRAVCSSDYNESQIDAWVSSVENEQRWIDMISNQYVFVALDNGIIIGFGTLDHGSHIDMFYVHKDYQGQGIAKSIYRKLELEAIRQNSTSLSADVSKTARAFFEKMGFSVMTEQTIHRKSVTLTNYKMTKLLP
jgi:putative acetyltransferase